MLDTIRGIAFFGGHTIRSLSYSDLREVESFIISQIIQDYAELENPVNTKLVKGFVMARIKRNEGELETVKAYIVKNAEKTLL